MNLLVISCSHHPNSRSALLARAACDDLKTAGIEPDFLDLSSIELPFCDGHSSYGHENVGPVKERIQQASGILVATPVYNFDANAASKNLLELTGSAWAGKIVGFLCAAGGHSSYMSIMPFANSLMLDFRCVIIPRFVYATGKAFDKEHIQDGQIRQRVHGLTNDLVSFAKALQGRTDTSAA